MKYQVAFLPGVKEQDIPRAPREYQEAFVMQLQEMARGKSKGRELDGDIFEPGEWRKQYIEPPEIHRHIKENVRSGRQPGDGIRENKGGYRMVYRETEIRGTPTLVVASFGPRENLQVYKTAEQRILSQQQEQRRQALSNAALPRQATRKPPPTMPTPRNGAAPIPNQPRRGPRL